MRVVVAGVAGSGKSTVGAALSVRLGARFVDGDTLHSAANVEKMTSGAPLDDDDRWPWLDAIVRVAAPESHIVVACSALGRRHRDRLRQIPGLRIVFLALDQQLAESRAEARTDHFMSADMIASQFQSLELPGAAVVTVDASVSLATLVDHLVAVLGNSAASGDKDDTADNASVTKLIE